MCTQSRYFQEINTRKYFNDAFAYILGLLGVVIDCIIEGVIVPVYGKEQSNKNFKKGLW